MNLTWPERSESDLKCKRYQIFKLELISAHSFKILHRPFCKNTISFLLPSSSHHSSGRGGGRADRLCWPRGEGKEGASPPEEGGRGSAYGNKNGETPWTTVKGSSLEKTYFAGAEKKIVDWRRADGRIDESKALRRSSRRDECSGTLEFCQWHTNLK
jgi:hypothetical protein